MKTIHHKQELLSYIVYNKTNSSAQYCIYKSGIHLMELYLIFGSEDGYNKQPVIIVSRQDNFENIIVLLGGPSYKYVQVSLYTQTKYINIRFNKIYSWTFQSKVGTNGTLPICFIPNEQLYYI